MNREIPNPVDKPTVTVAQAAQILGIGRASAYIAIERGQIPALRFGRMLRVPTAWLVKTLYAEAS